MFLIAALNAANAVAQSPFPITAMTTANQQLIEDAVKDGIIIVRRDYRLRDNAADPPEYFGWQNRNWFGESYSPAVKVKGGYYLADRAVRPWAYDAKFEQYAKSDKYVPVNSTGEYRTANNANFTALRIDDDKLKEISRHRIYLAGDDAAFGNNGFFTDNADGTKSGWLVWLVTDNPLEERNDQTPTFLVYRSELTFEKGKELYEINDPATDKHVLGGFYFLPKITGIGQINFHLSGILHHEKDKWHVVRVDVLTDGGLAPVGEGGLTPIVIEPKPQNGDGSKTPTRRRER